MSNVFAQHTRRSAWLGSFSAIMAVAIVTLLARTVFVTADLSMIVMLYLLAVVAVALRAGRRVAGFCAVLGVLAFDFFCVAPRLSFAVNDLQYLLTFAVMLLVGMILAHLTTSLRRQAELTALREQTALRLYELAQALAGCTQAESVCKAIADFVAQDFGGFSEIWWEDSTHALGRLSTNVPSVFSQDTAGEVSVLLKAPLEQGRLTECPDPARAGFVCLLCPLDAPMRRRGVLVLSIPRARNDGLLRQQAASIALLAATTLERLHYVDVAQQAMLDMESERLRSTILAALSHDLRTPLTVILGRLDALCEEVKTSGRSLELAHAIRAQVVGVNDLTDKLLDLARLQSGKVHLRQEWQSVEEIVGAALAHLGERLALCQIRVDVPADLPLVEFDAVLMERVLCNLLDNAVRYGAREIGVKAWVEPDRLRLVVEDSGPGIAPELLPQIFEPFVRGEQAKAGGLGLGLSICRLIIKAHGGEIQARNPAQGGGCFDICLPRRNPPVVELDGDYA